MLKALFLAVYQLFDLEQVILYLKVNFSSITHTCLTQEVWGNLVR